MTQLVFGEISKAEAEKEYGIAHLGNPCIRLYGLDPFGRTCRFCKHLKRYRQSTRWMKCDLRKNTHGAATDHKAKWPACGKYERAL